MKIGDFKSEEYSFFFIILFPFLPFFSVVFFAFFISISPKIDKKIFYLFFSLISIYLGLINATKIPESDLLLYYQHYFAVDNFSLLQYLIIAGKEPVFYIFNYLMYYLTFGNIYAYLITITFIAYQFLFVAIFKFFKVLKVSNNIIVFSVLLAAFFPQLFSLSAHLIRQFMAAAILVYAIVQKIFYKKNVWLYLTIAIFTHSTALFFVPLLYLNALKSKIKLKALIAILLLLIIFYAVFPLILDALISVTGTNFLTYILIRFSQEGSLGEDPIGYLSFIMTGILILILLLTQNKLSIFENKIKKEPIFNFTNIFIVFSVFVFANITNTLISKRFFFYSYFFFPLIFPLILKSKSINFVYFRAIIILSVISFFIFRLESGVWKYADTSQILFGSIFDFGVSR